MSKGKKVYTSESISRANRRFILQRHTKVTRKTIPKINVDPASPGRDRTVVQEVHVPSPDQTKIGDE